MKPIYKINELSFSYSSNKQIFRNIHLELTFEKITLLSGKNGSGKTTLCRLLSGLEKRFQGCILLENKNLSKIPANIIANKVVYLKQESLANVVAANPDEDLAIWQHKFRLNNNTTFEKRRSNALEYFDIYNFKDKPIWELSSGQIKRIGLSSLLLNEDKYWILDEPTSSLDNSSIELLGQVLENRKKNGKGCLIISHQFESYKPLFDCWLQIENESIIEKDKFYK
ncbi:MAG: ABC transporter ATP-binding protein [Candidatus Cloacimonadota bacterium]|nr:ABC transporter ATP-binding protein [Candidatus Cloacimonadota bacterium]